MEKELFEFLNSKEFNILSGYYEKPTYLGILGVSRKEIVHSNFLAWLLDPKGGHGLGDFPIQKVLEMCYSSLPKSIQEHVIVGDYKIISCDVSRELRIGNAGFLDLFIKTVLSFSDESTEELYIVLENKVESFENEDQTLKYQQWCDNNLKGNNILMIYLTSRVEEEISSNKFIKISYSEFNDKVLNYCNNKTTDTIAKYLISDYICCLSQPTSSTDNDYNCSVLAISKEELDTTRELYVKYGSVIDYIIDELIKRDNELITNMYKTRILIFKGILNALLQLSISEETKSHIEVILFNKSQKIEYDGRIYKPYGKKGNSLGYLALALIKNYVNKYSISFEELYELINSKEWLSPWLDEIICKTMPEDPGHFFMLDNEVVMVSNVKVYVARYWVFDDVIELAKLLNEEIKYR